MNIITKADIYQTAAHTACGQKRKFSGLPYASHPRQVAAFLRMYVDNVTDEMIAAALLHDIIEDTDITADDLRLEFSEEVVRLVVGLTNVTEYLPGTKRPLLKRHARHQINVRRLAAECWKVKTIKLADCLHNIPDIIKNDKHHATIYVPEKRVLLDSALVGGDAGLWQTVDTIISDYYAENSLT